MTAVHNKALVITSILVAFGTLFYACAAVFQVWLMSESSKHTDEQIGRIISNINWLSRSMDLSQKTAQQAISQTGDQFRQEERPIVWVTNDLENPRFVQFAGHPTGQIIWKWSYTNYGNMPADNVHYFQEIKLGNGPFVECYGEPKKGDASAPLPPNKVDFTDAVSQPGISSEDGDRLVNHTDHGVTIRVHIHYTDPSGFPYETVFCLSNLQTKAVNYCRNDNYIK